MHFLLINHIAVLKINPCHLPSLLLSISTIPPFSHILFSYNYHHHDRIISLPTFIITISTQYPFITVNKAHHNKTTHNSSTYIYYYYFFVKDFFISKINKLIDAICKKKRGKGGKGCLGLYFQIFRGRWNQQKEGCRHHQRQQR